MSLFIVGVREGKRHLMYGPCLALVAMQIVSMSLTMALNDMNGNQAPFTRGGKLFWSYVYQAPWCRISPYAVGMFMALWHDQRVARATAQGRDWKDWGELELKGGLRIGTPGLAFALFIAALGTMFGLMSSHYAQFRCETDRVDCEAWAGLY